MGKPARRGEHPVLTRWRRFSNHNGCFGWDRWQRRFQIRGFGGDFCGLGIRNAVGHRDRGRVGQDLHGRGGVRLRLQPQAGLPAKRPSRGWTHQNRTEVKARERVPCRQIRRGGHLLVPLLRSALALEEVQSHAERSPLHRGLGPRRSPRATWRPLPRGRGNSSHRIPDRRCLGRSGGHTPCTETYGAPLLRERR